jgi:glucokinase
VVLAGRHGAAGEIGYNLRTPGSGPDDRLEDVAGGKALEAAAAALLGVPDVGRLLDRMDVDTTASPGRFLDDLCFHLVNLAIAVDPERIVVGGGLVRSWSRLQPRLASALAAAVPFPPELVVAAHPFDAPLLGALALGRSALRGVPRNRDVISEGAPA